MTDRRAFRWNVAVAAFSLAAAGAYAYAGGLFPHTSTVAVFPRYCADDMERSTEPYGVASLKQRKEAASEGTVAAGDDAQACVREVAASR